LNQQKLAEGCGNVGKSKEEAGGFICIFRGKLLLSKYSVEVVSGVQRTSASVIQ